MCAVDALGIAFMANQATTVRSREPMTGHGIEGRVDPAGVQESEPRAAVVVAAVSGGGPSASCCFCRRCGPPLLSGLRTRGVAPVAPVTRSTNVTRSGEEACSTPRPFAAGHRAAHQSRRQKRHDADRDPPARQTEG
jgi:hypothetical protein